ncbi:MULTISPECIES: BLUF domain-containing protein [Corallincola]|uniref:BLUF domain-containing protein n=1 Tax=Corallincola TaxID=1775176 RepID=UPI0018F23F9E|nr:MULTISPECIES: BLUF domain-containing protein [Corallincola]
MLSKQPKRFTTITCYELVYRSVSDLVWSPEALAELLALSRQANKQKGVTGLLLYRQGCFFQILEGERDAVEQVFAAISTDPRHYDIELLNQGVVPARSFPDWSMGFDTTVAEKAAEVGFNQLISGKGLADPRLKLLRAKYCSVTFHLIKAFLSE